jgi:hypothetical protein
VPSPLYHVHLSREGFMRRATLAAIGTLGLLIAILLSAYAAAAPSRPASETFTGTVLGDDIMLTGTSFENAWKVTDSIHGTGAGWNQGSNSSTTLPLTGRATGAEYFAGGVKKFKETYTIGAANATGIAVLAGSGECIAGGTGAFKDRKCTFTEKGTLDVNTGIFDLRLKGAYTRPTG